MGGGQKVCVDRVYVLFPSPICALNSPPRLATPPAPDRGPNPHFMEKIVSGSKNPPFASPSLSESLLSHFRRKAKSHFGVASRVTLVIWGLWGGTGGHNSQVEDPHRTRGSADPKVYVCAPLFLT